MNRKKKVSQVLKKKANDKLNSKSKPRYVSKVECVRQEREAGEQ